MIQDPSASPAPVESLARAEVEALVASRPSTVPPVQRVFLGWDEPALVAAARHLIERHARPTTTNFPTLDLSHLRVALPGRRAANRLLERLLDEAEARGLALLPPDLCTAGELPERLFTPRHPTPPPEVAEAAWRAALRSLPSSLLQTLLPEPPAPEDLGVWTSLARTLAQLHALLGAEGVRFVDVARACATRDLLHNDEARWVAMARVQGEMHRRLEAEGFQDREAQRAAALAEGWVGDGVEPLGLVLLGLPELSGVVRRFVTAWPGTVEILIHAPAERAPDMDPLGAVDPDRWEGCSLQIPAEKVRVVGRPEAQAEAVLSWLRGLNGRYAAEEIVVGVPDPEVLPFLAGQFSAAGVPARAAAGRPMHRTAPFRLFEGVAAFLEGRRFEDLAALLRHPDAVDALRGGAGLSREAVVAAADRYHARSLPAFFQSRRGSAERGGRIPRGPGAGDAEDPAWRIMVQLQRELDRLLPDDGGRRPLSAWAPEMRALISRFFPGADGEGVRSVDRQAPGDRELVRFCALVQAGLEGLSALPPSLDTEPVTLSQALRVLLARIGGEAVPEPAEEGAIELLGWLELPMEDAPVVVLTGVNEPFLPESVTGDPFLPHALRSVLGLPDNRRRRARDLYLMTAILQCREATLLVAGRRDGAGNPLRPSRLLLADTPEVVAARILARLSDDEPGSEGADASAASVQVPVTASHEGVRPLVLPPEPVLSHPGGAPDRIAVTRFRALLADPYRYALEAVLELGEETDQAREMDPMVFGNLAHAVLEAWAKTPGADEEKEPQIVAHLNDLLNERFEGWFGSRPLPALRVQREQLRTRLRSVATLQAKRNLDGWRIAAVEAKPAGEGVPFDVDGIPILLRGRIDRVDHHPESGRWQLLDVKTSEHGSKPDEAHRKGRGSNRVWVDLQLPLYRILARGLRTAEGTSPLLPLGAVPETGYLLVPGGDAAIEMSPWTEDELAEAEAAARAVVRELRENRFEWDPRRSTIRPDDPLAVVVGKGVLELASTLSESEGEGGER